MIVRHQLPLLLIQREIYLVKLFLQRVCQKFLLLLNFICECLFLSLELLQPLHQPVGDRLLLLLNLILLW